MTHVPVHNKAGKKKNPKAWEKAHRTSATFKRQQKKARKTKPPARGAKPANASRRSSELEGGLAELGIDPSMFRQAVETEEDQVPYFTWSALRGAAIPGEGGTMEFALEANSDDALKAFLRMPKSQKARVQKMLWEGGWFDAPYYNPKERLNVLWGEVDQDTIQAFGKALGMAELTGDMDDVLTGIKGVNRRARLLFDRKKKMKPADELNPNAIEDYMMSVDKLANEYMLPMSEEAKRKWAQDVMLGRRKPRQEEEYEEMTYG